MVPRRVQFSKNIRALPDSTRAELCRILNRDNRWKELGYLMEYDEVTIKHITEVKNPAGTLLAMWGCAKHTIVQLFALLKSMDNHEAMVQLNSFLPATYRVPIDEVEYKRQQRTLRQRRATRRSNVRKIGVQTLNQNDLQPPVIPETVANVTRKESHEVPCPPLQILLTNPNDPGSIISPCKETKQEIPYTALTLATDQWCELYILGSGGFGTVYRAHWNNIGIAIKRASDTCGPNAQQDYKIQVDQAEKEVEILVSCRHENILSVYGFSLGGNPPCLVYEYMPNGSLSHRLRLKDGTRPLNWPERLKIAYGTARGLHYLHTFRNRPLIHGDIKSSNILLDRFFEPKIGDFGLALEGPEIGSSIRLSDIGGTRAYLPDDYLQEKLLSTKVDVYSYGIVLFEIGSGLRAHEPNERYRLLRDAVDNRYYVFFEDLQDMKAGVDNHDIFRKLMGLGLWCADRVANDRPEMDKVCQEFIDLF